MLSFYLLHTLSPIHNTHLSTCIQGMISLWLTFITQWSTGVQQFAHRSCHTTSAGWTHPIPVGDCGWGISGVRAGHCASVKCNGIHLHQYGGLLHRKRLVGRQSGCVCCHASRLWLLDAAHGLLAACGKLFNSCYCRFAALGEYPLSLFMFTDSLLAYTPALSLSAIPFSSISHAFACLFNYAPATCNRLANALILALI